MNTVPEIVFVIPEVPQINFLIDLQGESLYKKWLQLGLGTGDYTDFLNWLRIKGDIGASCEFQVSATHIQWRVVGDTNWIDLIALSEFKGEKGDKGDDGYTPVKGIDYNDGHTPYIPEGANTWWINGIDTGKKAIAVDGAPLLYEDLTPEQIAELQQPALDAAATANAAGQAATEAAGQVSDVIVIAEQTIDNAEQATENANNAASQLIDGAETDYNTLKKLQDKIKAVEAIIGDAAGDDDNLINTVRELLAVFSNFPEGSDMATLLTAKVNVTDIYNALDCIIECKVLDARQGKVLNDAIITLTNTVGNKLNKPGSTQNTLADNDAFVLRKVDGTVVEILKTELYAVLDDYFAALSGNPAFSNGLKTSAVTDLNGNSPFVKQSDSIIYNPTPFGTFTTVSTIGNRLIKTGGTAFPYVGLKITINGVDYIMSSRIGNNEIEIVGTFPQNFAGISFTVNCIGFRYFAGLFYMYDYQGRIIASSTVGGGFSPSIIEMAKCYLSGATQDLTNDFILRWSSTNSVFGAKDLGISRNAAGAGEVNNGTPGQYRDWKVRKLIQTDTPEYADNAAAIAGGLTAGMPYRTGDLLKIVH